MEPISELLGGLNALEPSCSKHFPGKQLVIATIVIF